MLVVYALCGLSYLRLGFFTSEMVNIILFLRVAGWMRLHLKLSKASRGR